MKISNSYDWQKLTKDDGHYFFGYYDRCPWNNDNSKHLVLKAEQGERLPVRGETAEIGYIDRNTFDYVKLTETRTWCHQQGAMTLWLKHKADTFIYNDYDESQEKLIAKIYEIGKGIVGNYDLPIYAVSPDGRWGASLNFCRIPRRGYSYADAILEKDNQPDLDTDGIFLVNMHSGKAQLLVSYRQIIARHPVPFDLEDMYQWLNHIIFNRDSSKLLFLFRHCKDKSIPGWHTNMYTVNIDGSDLACTLPQFYWNGMISHQIWGRTPNEILIDANWRKSGSEYLVYDDNVRPLEARRISKGMGPMGHLIFSPDGKWMLADTYPQDNLQSLALVDVTTGNFKIIGQFQHKQPSNYPVDVRCDLHPRWSTDGSSVTVDSIHNGKRQIYLLEFCNS